MKTAAKKKNSLASSVIASMVVLISALLFTSAATASSVSPSLLASATSIGPNTTAIAPTTDVVAQKTRVEIFLGVSLKSVERSELNPANATRYYDVLKGVALECIVAPKGGLIDDASRFAQRDYTEVFSGKGIKAYSELAGKRIVTIDDLAGALRSGAIKPSQLPLDVIRRGDASIILNTRSSEALRRAGIDRSLWNGVDRTGNELFESLLNDQLKRNMLGNGGVIGPISQGFGL